jgi:hypothetical protein
LLRRHRVPLVDVLEEYAGLHLEDLGRVGAWEALVEGLLDSSSRTRARDWAVFCQSIVKMMRSRARS